MLTFVGCKGEERHVTPKSDTCGTPTAQAIQNLDTATTDKDIEAWSQQREIDRQRAYKQYAAKVACLIGLLAIMGLFLAWYAARQWRKTQLKNRVLAQQIKDAMIYKEQNEELKRQIGVLKAAAVPPSAPPHSTEENERQTDHQPSEKTLDHLTPEELFHYIEHEVRQRLLFLNPAFDRQTIMDEFHLSKERVGAAFAQGSKYDSLPQFVCDLRLDYASKLLTTTDLSITEIMTKAGFSNASVFSRYFSRKYGISPSQYRRANKRQ